MVRARKFTQAQLLCKPKSSFDTSPSSILDLTLITPSLLRYTQPFALLPRRDTRETEAAGMKRKKQNPTTSDADLESVIHSHAEFFDHLIELIPARFRSDNDDADSKPYYRGLSKPAKASLKRQTKQNTKLARRQRFDPDHKTTKPSVADDGDLAVKPIEDVEGENKEKSVTYEELRHKLRQKIESLRGNRGDSNRSNRGERRKREGEYEREGGNENETRSADKEDEDVEEIIEYGKVRLGDDEEKSGKMKKKRKVSKVKELEQAKKLEEVKKEKSGVAEKESWKAATSRAMGVKVHDNARLIKESIKKEKKKKEKNAEKWKERVETREKMMEDRQRKRKDNIVGRINEKKQRKIAKREKKLMRPGFEGRKDGFITQN